MKRRLLTITFLAGLSGCGADAGQDHAESDACPSTVADLALDVSGTAENGDLVFAYAAAATRLADNAIVIADRLGVAVRLIDQNGNLVRTVGREGGGPGEFRAVSWLGQCAPDSVFVWDSRQVRMSVFNRSGEFVRQYRVPADPSITSRISTVSCTRSGEFALRGMPSRLSVPTPADPGPYSRAPLWIADVLGHVSQTFEDIPWAEGRPLGKVAGVALSAGYVYVGSADSAFVDLYRTDGTFITLLSIGVERRRPTERHYEHSIAMQVAGGGTVEFRREWHQRLREIPMPEYMPAYTGLFTDDIGMLWVVVSVPGDSATQLRALDREGTLLRDVYLPADTRVLEVGRDYIIGAYEDADGEPHVAMYTMTPFETGG